MKCEIEDCRQNTFAIDLPKCEPCALVIEPYGKHLSVAARVLVRRGVSLGTFWELARLAYRVAETQKVRR